MPLPASSNLWLIGFRNQRWYLFLEPPVGFSPMNLSNQCLKLCMLVASTTSCGWGVGLKHILCGKNTYFCLLSNFLPAWFHALLVTSCIGRGSGKENPCYCVTSGLMTFIYCPLLVTFPQAFQKEMTLLLSLSLLSSLHLLQMCSWLEMQESEEQGWVTISRTSYSILACATQ